MNFLNKPELVIYDWDNTLVNTNPVCLLSLNRLFQDYNFPQISLEDVIRINGYNFDTYFNSLFGFERVEEAKRKYREIYEKVSGEYLAPLPNAEDTLKYIQSLNIPQMIISNKHFDLVQKEAQKFDLEKYFIKIVGPDEAKCAKPDLRMFHYALAQVDTKLESQTPDKLWFFGDSMIDLEFARNINARLIFLNPIHIEFKNDYRIEALTHEEFLKNYSIS